MEATILYCHSPLAGFQITRHHHSLPRLTFRLIPSTSTPSRQPPQLTQLSMLPPLPISGIKRKAREKLYLVHHRVLCGRRKGELRGTLRWVLQEKRDSNNSGPFQLHW